MTEKQKNILKISSISICIVLGIYIVLSMFFTTRFYFGTEVNGIGIGGKTVQEAKEQVANEISMYSLSLEGRNNFKGEILGKDIGLTFNDTDEISDLKKEQKPFKWVSGIFRNNEMSLGNYIKYDKVKLQNSINNLSIFKEDNIIKPENPKFTYDNGEYKVSKEVMGTEVDKKLMIKKIEEAIENDEKSLNLDTAKLYIDPKYTLESDKVNKTKKALDKYVSAKITYMLGDKTKVVDGSLINKWIYVDSNLNPKIDIKKVSAFVSELGRECNTVGQGISFKTTDGRQINVPGGNYGWLINNTEETNKLIEDIKEGKKIEREPVYTHRGLVHGSNEIGNTYVEIDLGKQHIWCYKDGQLVTEGDIVTGNVSKNLATPPGLFRLNYKEKGATLRGEDYETKVEYWMPFNGGIGLHDGWWRTKFGGDIYKTNGSHGCVNLPPKVAEDIFNNISSGTPIVCYN